MSAPRRCRMGTVFVIRHGQDEDNAKGILGGRWRDGALTELGRRQAGEVGASLVTRGVAIVYSSPLRRARETADIVAGALGGPPVVVDPRLAERDFGALAGRPVADIPRYSSAPLRRAAVTYFLDASDTEEFAAVHRRALSFVDDLRRRHRARNVAVVTHGDTGIMLCAAYQGLDWRDGLLRLDPLENGDIVELTGH